MKKRIVCFGDSNTWGYNPLDASRYDESTRWTALLQKKLGSGYAIVEEGQNGRTIASNTPNEGSKSAMAYIEPCLETCAPFDLIIVMLGTNDIKVKFFLTAEEISACMNRLLSRIESFMKYQIENPEYRNYKLLLVSPIEITNDVISGYASDVMGGEKAVSKSAQMSRYYKALAEKHGCYYMNAAEYAAPGAFDGLHLDPKNHKKLADAMCVKIKEILG